MSSPSSSASSTLLTTSSSALLTTTTTTTLEGPDEATSTPTQTRPLFPERTHASPRPPPAPGSSYPASLYLFVFLATLLLLLALSVAILVRSFVLRRRFRRRVEEALAAGLLAGHPGSSNRARWRNMVRPKLHDVAVVSDDKAARWDDFQPLNATLIPASAEKQQQPASTAAAPVSDAPPASSPALARIFGESRFPHSLAALRRRQEQHHQPAAHDADDDDDDTPRLAEPQLQLSVLLAMPARHGEPAELALGVARERVPEGWRPPDNAAAQDKTVP